MVAGLTLLWMFQCLNHLSLLPFDLSPSKAELTSTNQIRYRYRTLHTSKGSSLTYTRKTDIMVWSALARRSTAPRRALANQLHRG